MENVISPRKRLIFSLITVVIILFFVEVTARVTFRLIFQKRFADVEYTTLVEKTFEERYRTDLKSEKNQTRLNNHIIHPYLGYIGEHQALLFEHEASLYQEADNASQSTDPDQLTVAIFGGSFAHGIYNLSIEPIVEKLESATGKSVTVLPVAMGGYKQPQQLMALTYLLAQGIDIDIVVNVDGFNEAALSTAEYYRRETFPLYPRSWPLLVSSLLTSDQMLLVSRIDRIASNRQQFAGFFANWKLCRSAALCVFWIVGDNRFQNQYQLAAVAFEDTTSETSHAKSGPPIQFEDDAHLHSMVKTTWQTSSLQMHHLSQANQIAYYHFLQPNQYDPDSKPLSATELEEAFNASSPYRDSIPVGYDNLREGGEWLVEQGVNFYDFSTIFVDSTETYYVDPCCHLNKAGYAAVANAIADMILEQGLD
ncbi:MAG: hypothetical protein ACPG8W_03140 [Candidatus Promineifilaceae bacterium]